MEQNVKLKLPKMPALIGRLTHSNQFLKLFSIGALGVVILCLFVLILIVNRPPMVLSFNQDGTPVGLASLPSPEAEVEKAIRAYIDLRYQWNPKTVKSQMEKAKSFIDRRSMKAYGAAIESVSNFSVGQKVVQRVYPNEIKIDLNKQVAMVTGDRVTIIQGLMAAGRMNLRLQFASGSRSESNPWGIYVTKEIEHQ